MRTFFYWATNPSSLTRWDIAGLVSLVTWLTTDHPEIGAGWGIAVYLAWLCIGTIIEMELHPEQSTRRGR